MSIYNEFFEDENILPLINERLFFLNTNITNDYIITAARLSLEITIWEKHFLDDLVYNDLHYGKDLQIDYKSPLALFIANCKRKIL